MSLKLNTESLAGQMLNMAANQATGKNNAEGEDFEQMLWQMSSAQDELVMSTGQGSQSSQSTQSSQASQKTQGSQSQNSQTAKPNQETQKTDNASQTGDSTQNGQTQVADPTEEPVMQELAAMLAQVQPVILNVVTEQNTVETQAAGGAVEVLAAADLAGYQGAVQQNVQQAAGELAGELVQAGPNEQAEQTVVMGQFTEAMAQNNGQTGGQQLGAEVMTSGKAEGEAVTQEEPEVEVLTTADSQMFGELEAAPVKVAEVKQQAPIVQPEAANGAEQIAQQIQQALQSGDSTVRINLNPANLGSLTVEIARLSDGTLSVILSTVTEKAANLLNKHSASLQTMLMNNTQGQVKVEVENRMDEQPTQQFLNPEGESNAKEQHQQRQQKQEDAQPEDFLQQLRLGLISVDQAI